MALIQRTHMKAFADWTAQIIQHEIIVALQRHIDLTYSFAIFVAKRRFYLRIVFSTFQNAS